MAPVRRVKKLAFHLSHLFHFSLSCCSRWLFRGTDPQIICAILGGFVPFPGTLVPNSLGEPLAPVLAGADPQGGGAEPCRR